MARAVQVQVTCDECHKVKPEDEIVVRLFQYGQHKPVSLDICNECDPKLVETFAPWRKARAAEVKRSAGGKPTVDIPAGTSASDTPKRVRPHRELCPICGKKPRGATIREHIERQHTGKDGKVQCPSCESKLSDPNGLLVHMGRAHKTTSKKGK